MNPELEIQILDPKTQDFRFVEGFDDPDSAWGTLELLRDLFPDALYRLIRVVHEV